MKKFIFLFTFLLFLSCQDFGKLKVVTQLPSQLEEVSGITILSNSNLFWMLNDSGNKPYLYGISPDGKIKDIVEVEAKNHDWEDLTSDKEGNLYIGDFGNNQSKRQNLVILKIKNLDLLSKESVEVERIEFYYPDQTKFPAKKKNRYYDAESFFYLNNYLYIFTKSRVKGYFGVTSLYKIPAKKGKHKAELISTFENDCNDLSCWITSGAISSNGKKVVLLTHKSVLLFTHFNEDNFLNGTVKKLPLEHTSQKESVTFKDENTLYISDEKAHGSGGFLYAFHL